MPSSASRRRDCCWESANVKLFSPLKIIGSGELQLIEAISQACVCIRYATTTQSLRSMASSATPLVRSIVRRTEFICRRIGSKGASSSTALHQIREDPIESSTLTTSVVEAFISQSFGISAEWCVSIELEDPRGNTNSQFPHRTYDSSGERTRFVSRVRTHSGGSADYCTEHEELETTNREDDLKMG